jgi:hypothetical protein
MAVLLGTPEVLKARTESDKRIWGGLIRSAGLQGENA